MRIALGFAAAALAAACATRRAQMLATDNASLRLAPVRGIDEFVPTPADNPLTAAKVRLGERLFFDRRLSRDRSMACASCHLPDSAFADTVPVSRGVRGVGGRRNTPTLLNRAYGTAFSWDGRHETLERQVVAPIADALELDLPIDQLLARLNGDGDYRRAFAAAFAGSISASNVARALASYVRTLRSGDAPVDRYREGDPGALTPEAQRGLVLFSGKANCSACHIGANFTDERFHSTGVAAESADLGRYAVTRKATDRGAFKTPTLRDVGRTAPYMHDGSILTLDAVIDFYDGGGRPTLALDPEIRPLRLTHDEKRELLAFLRALSGLIVSGTTQSPTADGSREHRQP